MTTALILTNALAILAFAALLNSFKKNKKQVDRKNKKLVEQEEPNVGHRTGVAITIALLILIVTILKNFNDSKSVNKISSLTSTVNTFIHRIDSLEIDPADRAKSGFSISGIITVEDMPLKRDQYVVDCSDYSNKDRISIFTDSSHNLIYRIVDDFGQIYTIRTPRNQFTYKKGAAYFIYCDYGVAYDFSFMRMYLDRNKIGELFISNGGDQSHS